MWSKCDSDMTAILAHEIKNPVSIIKINLDHIRNIVPHSVIKNIDVIDNALGRIDKIIEGYRLINIKTSNNELIYLEDMLVDIIDDYNISKPNIRFVYNCDSDVSLYGNYDKLCILFYNIYKNAVEAIVDSGIIETTSYYENNRVIVEIRDNGTGIKDIKSIGKPYYTTKENGTGLGVVICKNIVEEHKGDLFFENTSSGSLVRVELPVNI